LKEVRGKLSTADSLLKMRRELSSTNLGPVYLFHTKSGERDRDSVEFLVSLFIDIVVSNFRGIETGKFNVDVMDSSQVEVENALRYARTPPMFGEKRLVVFRGGEKLKKDDWNKVILYIKNPVHSTTLILSFPFVQIPEDVIKLASERGYLRYIESLKERSIPSWIKGIFEEEGVKCSPEAIARLVEFAGTNLQVLEDAKNKLILFTLNKGKIDSEDVEEMLLQTRTSDIYELVDAIFVRDMGKIFMILKRLENQKTEPLFIETILAQQIRGLLKIKTESSKGKNDISTLSSLTGLKDFLVKKYLSASSKFGLNQVEEALSICNELNYTLKHSRVNSYRIIEKACIDILRTSG